MVVVTRRYSLFTLFFLPQFQVRTLSTSTYINVVQSGKPSSLTVFIQVLG